MGQKFCTNQGLQNKSAIDTIKNIENLIQDTELPIEIIDDIRYGVISSVKKYLHNKRTSH